ncbi:MAG: hypothetical protein RL129_102 [Actinomycetota bacterium]|jgi:hypothetical protein
MGAFMTAPTMSTLASLLCKKKVKLEKFQNFIINLFLVTIVLYEFARISVNPSISSKFLGSIFLLFIVTSRKNFDIRAAIRKNWISTLGTIIIVFPFILKLSENHVILGPSAMGNNDIANYAILSKYFAKNGFIKSDEFANLDLGYINHFLQHQSANSLLTFFSSVFNISSWKILVPTIAIFTFFSIKCLSYCIGVLFTFIDESRREILGTAILASPLMSYVFGNYFLGQVSSIIIAVGVASVLFEIYINAEVDIRNKIQLPVLIALSIYAYPVFLIPWAGLIFIMAISYSMIVTSNSAIKTSRKVVPLILLGILVAFDYLNPAYNLGKYQGETLAGWELPPLNPLSLLVSPFFIPRRLPKSIFIISWTILILILITISIKSVMDKKKVGALVTLATLNVLVVISIALWKNSGFGTYQVWKMSSYLLPLTYILLIGLAYSSGKFGKTTILIFIFCSLTSPMQTWAKSLNRDDLVVSADLASLNSKGRLGNLKELNVDLRPYFETMIAFSVLDGKKIYLSGESYYPSLQNKSACTLTRIGNTKYTKVQRLNSSYGLAPSADGKCMPRNLISQIVVLNVNEAINFSADGNGEKYLGNGWFGAEQWGTWSEGIISEIYFAGTRSDSYEFHIFGQPFQGDYSFTPKLKIKLNGLVVYSTSFKKGGFNGEIVFRGKVNGDGNVNKIEFVFENTKSPHDIGLSNDTRKLGFGIIKLELT